ncbi:MULTISPECIES: hypothetical protein [Thermus]|jgi:hypothetical protein|uniref:Uncharacterized protein n=3 Tax=Thermus TaxID=270 RepID=A0A7V4ALQ6_9DEIN|nr:MULTISPECIES: hypothetical protein [Thermus]KPD32281.1 hypothetical protein AN926_04810 [Thermus scotoductus]RTG92046.1 hypothetical protein CSW51_11770 [Thermus scotoductus]RTH22877.1 hypothetical protein CSW38_12180 [Thermus scotoductus]RTH24048.1 hypothetical protein CSW40_08875 [Thermus scotoductus]RTI05174.1 hypothetical protein CSW30_12100 [Thermus scotoductus]
MAALLKLTLIYVAAAQVGLLLLLAYLALSRRGPLPEGASVGLLLLASLFGLLGVVLALVWRWV